MSSNNANENNDVKRHFPMKTWFKEYDPDSDLEEDYLEYDDY